ncbi:MAG: L-erythro-3,5-diaminohexanoate dehydrogenase [Candidatus Cloacimonadota bacterium]|nr:MAG: L-erythro-3,5-diaminohexanoate dehydrogenase [Candidatus Cloacimonadota bacterium]
MNKSSYCPFGTHRVISPENALPQNAEKVDNSLPIKDNEILIDVEVLNIDSASFYQMMTACDHAIESVGERICKTVELRGKQHNPVTGSGGMLLGTVKEMGEHYENRDNLKVGDRVATLVSLSLTPLKIDKIIKIHPHKDQVEIKGHAILFSSSIISKLPSDMDESLALAILDVCGAPAQTKRLVKKDFTVVVLGAGGKSGTLCLAAASDILKGSGKLIAIEPFDNGVKRLKHLGFCDHVLQVDAKNPVDVFHAVQEATNNKMADLVINCANVPDTEMASILSAKLNGIVYLFSMASSFSKAALGAEGVRSDATLIIGNGYAPDHAEYALQLIRDHKNIQELFETVYSD